jgi:signal transduction histidine kinase
LQKCLLLFFPACFKILRPAPNRTAVKNNLRLLYSYLHLSLRLKVALAFGIPVILLIILFSFNHYFRQREILDQHFQRFSIQLGDVILGGLHNSMMKNDPGMIQYELDQISRTEGLSRVWIVDLDGIIQRTSIAEEEGMKVGVDSTGCRECHRQPAESRPRVVNQTGPDNTLRVVTPIRNDPECHLCHEPQEKHLGILLIDTSLVELNQDLLQNLWLSWFVTILAILLGIVAALYLIQWIVVRPIEAIHQTLSAYQNSDFSVRVPTNGHIKDELSGLAETFNSMADILARNQQEQQEIAKVRQSAVLEERERIARELHDGVAQFLGYVNTKTLAVQLLLDKEQKEDAVRQLKQLEQAVQEQSVDVRASIVGLKLAVESGTGLAASLGEFCRQCNRISDLEIQFTASPGVEDVRLSPEVELHLLRIVQEAVSNIRKHSAAKRAQVALTLEESALVIVIRDSGIGFNPYTRSSDQMIRFGLQIMHERAKLIGSELSILSEADCGTTIRVRLELEQT